ncbi:MAG: flagellar FlbD family protein [candidate division KSB1 bacterium]|nr:flagellar FlbD family protein [candidate division KSB1 bacterium]
MIQVTRLNGSEIIINAELIETIEAAPDTIITLTTKSKYVVREGVDEVLKKVYQYRRRLRSNNFSDDLDDISFKN